MDDENEMIYGEVFFGFEFFFDFEEGRINGLEIFEMEIDGFEK